MPELQRPLPIGQPGKRQPGSGNGSQFGQTLSTNANNGAAQPNGSTKPSDEPSKPGADDQPAPARKKVLTDDDRAAQVAALMRGDPVAALPVGDQDGDGSGDTGEQPDPKPRKPKTAQDVAEAMELTPDEFYALEVGIGGQEEPVTIGKLKDAYKDRAKLEKEVLDRKAALIDQEVNTARQRRLWDQLGSEIARAAPKGLMNALQAQERQKLIAEEGKLFDALPALKDQTQLNQFRTDCVEILGRVAGYEPHEVAIYDHRQFKVLHYVRELERLVKSYRAIEGKPAQPVAVQTQGRGVTRPQGKPKGTAGQVSAVSSLLSGRR